MYSSPEAKSLTFETRTAQDQKELAIGLQKINDLESSLSTEKNSTYFYQIIVLSSYYLDIINSCLNINEQNLDIFERSNEPLLEQARKYFNSMITILSDSFGISIQKDIKSNQEILSELSELTPIRIINILNRMEYTINKLKYRFNKTSKYYPTLTGIYTGIAGFSIHVTNFKEFLIKIRDLSTPDINNIEDLILLTSQIISNAADFEVELFQSTHNKEHVEKGLQLLEPLETIYRYLSSPEINAVSRKKESWQRLLN